MVKLELRFGSGPQLKIMMKRSRYTLSKMMRYTSRFKKIKCHLKAGYEHLEFSGNFLKWILLELNWSRIYIVWQVSLENVTFSSHWWSNLPLVPLHTRYSAEGNQLVLPHAVILKDLYANTQQRCSVSPSPYSSPKSAMHVGRGCACCDLSVAFWKFQRTI